jgi:phage tail sheath gpL-like
VSASIVLTGFAANDPVPGVYLEILFAQGPAAGDSSPREILLMGNKLSTGAAIVDTTIYGPDTTVPLQTESDAIALFGTGSELHRMFRRVAKVNSDTTVRAIVVTESAGAKASGTVVYATSATASGNTRVWVGDEFVDTAITSGDTPTTIGAAVAASINAQSHWPVTAAAVTGTVTITARQNGLRGNWIRFMAAITSGIGTTATASSDAFLSGGTTADSNATALGTILPKKYYYIVSAAEDTTQFGAVASQVSTQAAPTSGIRQRCFAGSVDTLANATTVATTVNNPRAEVVWSEKSPWTPAELAANAAAVYSLFETTPNPRTNFAGFGNSVTTQPYWKVPASRTTTAHPTRTSIKSALNNGLTPIGVNPNGTTYLVNRITTRSLSGSIVDYRIRAAHKVTICDFFAEDAYVKLSLQNEGKRIANDPPDGARIPGPSVVTPSVVRAQLNRLIDDYDANDLLQNVPQIKAGMVVQRETNPTTRMGIAIPLQPIDNAEQFAVQISQVA